MCLRFRCAYLLISCNSYVPGILKLFLVPLPPTVQAPFQCSGIDRFGQGWLLRGPLLAVCRNVRHDMRFQRWNVMMFARGGILARAHISTSERRLQHSPTSA